MFGRRWVVGDAASCAGLNGQARSKNTRARLERKSMIGSNGGGQESSRGVQGRKQAGKKENGFAVPLIRTTNP